MKRLEIRQAIDAIVAEYGIESLCEWEKRPPQLRVTFGSGEWVINARAGMSKKALGFELGKLDTLARCLTARWPATPKRKNRRASRELHISAAAA